MSCHVIEIRPGLGVGSLVVNNERAGLVDGDGEALGEGLALGDGEGEGQGGWDGE